MNDQTETNPTELNKSQQPEQGAEKQAQANQSLNQDKANPEEKTFQPEQAQDETTLQAGQNTKDEAQEPQAETEIDDEETDTQSETSNS